jgi:ADP-heptose:LPS heptosyltransferase
MLEKFRLPAGRKIAVGTEVLWQSRSWPRQNWIDLCRRISERLRATIIQVGSDSCEFLGFGMNLIGKTTPRELAAVLSRCGLSISVDNGVAHLAAAVGTPVVGLFGPIYPELRLHGGKSRGVIASGSDCRGCFHTGRSQFRTCDKGHSCMAMITVDDVIRAAEELL